VVASAAYWVASQAREIIANKNNATQLGSIGVLCIHQNWAAYIAKEIGSVEIIRATKSADKALINSIEPITDDQRDAIRTELDAIALDFISTVKKGRAARLQTGEENIFSGKMYHAKQAHGLGMIDGQDTLAGAIERAAQLTTSIPTNSAKAAALADLTVGQPAVAMHAHTTMKFPKISALFGKSKQEATDAASAPENEGLNVDQASLAAAENSLAEMEANLGTLQGQHATAVESIAGLNATVSGQAAQISELTTQLAASQAQVADLTAQLAAKPTGQLTTVIAGDSEASQAADSDQVTVNKYHTSVDAEAARIKSHNQKNTIK
jgi:ClpP class serine protease